MKMAAREIEIDGDRAVVTLTQGYKAIIDACDAPLVAGVNWNVFSRNGIVYAIRNVRLGGKRSLVYMHRRIMGEPEGLQVDHVDGDGLNNRRSNLRTATNSQNRHNQRVSCKNTSGFKGVSWSRCAARWQAKITLHSKQIYLGRFDTAEAAHAAYCAASEKYHGAFGRTS